MNLSYLVLDIENNNSKKFKRNAGNFLFDPIVAIGLKNNKELHSRYLYPNKIESLQIQEDIIVGHNLSHDLLFLWHLDDLQNFFKRGGKIWDTSIAEYALTKHQHKYPALRDIAVNKYKCKEREKVMEKYWEDDIKVVDERKEIFKNFKTMDEVNQFIEINEYHIGKFNGIIHKGPIQTSEIPKELVIEDVENDVLDTEKVFLQQYEIAKNLGMLKLLEFRMDGLLACIEMEYNGMCVNLDILETNQKYLQELLDQKYKKLLEIINHHWK